MFMKEFFDTFDYPEEAVGFFLDAERRINDNSETEKLLDESTRRFETTDDIDMEKLGAAIDRTAELTGVPRRSAAFVFFTAMTGHLRDMYRKSALSDELWHDAVRDFGFKNRECHETYGEWGLFADWWHRDFLMMRIFALGRLQYQPAKYGMTDETIERHGLKLIPGETDALSIHIPSDGRLREEDVIGSLKKAYDFFPDKRVDGKLLFQCSSWIIYPKMLDFMTPGSNLSRFIGCFEILGEKQEPDFPDCWRLYGRDYSEGPSVLRRDTTLRRQYAEWLDKGGVPGRGRGIIIFDGEKILR